MVQYCECSADTAMTSASSQSTHKATNLRPIRDTDRGPSLGSPNCSPGYPLVLLGVITPVSQSPTRLCSATPQRYPVPPAPKPPAPQPRRRALPDLSSGLT